MGEAFESIMRGLSEVKAHREGKLKLKTTAIEIAPLPIYNAKVIKALRLDLRLSQAAFAQVLGVAKKTVEAWESGRNLPNGSAGRFLEVLRKDPDFILREKIVTYATKVSDVCAVAKHPCATLQVSAKAKFVLGLDGDLEMLAKDDELGRTLQDAQLAIRKRARKARPKDKT